MNWTAYLVSHTFELVLMALLLVGSGLFSGTETALFNLTGRHLYRMKHSSHSMARLVASLMRRPARLLNVLLLGNMIINVAYSAIAATLVFHLAQNDVAGWQVAAVALLPVLGLILIGEVTPKMLAYGLAERWSLAVAAPLTVIMKLLGPAVWLAEASIISPLSRIIAPQRTARAEIDANELAALLDLTAKRGLIGRDANALLQEIIHLTDLRVVDIMVPRVDMVAYDVNDTRQGLTDLIRKTHLRKVPVYDGDIDRVLGVIHARLLLLEPDTPLRDLVTEVPFVPEAANIERTLLQFRVQRKQTAFVVDEYGGLAGLVTLEDVMEEIVGDIQDSQDDQPSILVQRIGEKQYLLDGDLAIHEWVEFFKIDLSGQRISTIGGFVISLLGRIPTEGDIADYRNLRFTVTNMRGRRIGKLRLELTGGDL